MYLAGLTVASTRQVAKKPRQKCRRYELNTTCFKATGTRRFAQSQSGIPGSSFTDGSLADRSILGIERGEEVVAGLGRL